MYDVLEKPLPKASSSSYVEARLLEALLEARLALEFLERGFVRNAAGKIFQAWRALLAALLKLEEDKLLTAARTEEERQWLKSKAIPRVPTTRMKALSQLLEQIGHQKISYSTDKALHLHDYQYHGPDPDAELYRTPKEATYDIKTLAEDLAARVESIREKTSWGKELQEALDALKTLLNAAPRDS